MPVGSRYFGQAKPPKPAKGIAARTNYAPPKSTPQTRQQQVQFHIDHYNENPGKHAAALKALGVPSSGIKLLHKEHVQAAGIQMHGSGLLNYAVGLGAKTIQGLSQDALYALPSAAIMAKHVAQDVGDPRNYMPGGEIATGHPLPRTRKDITNIAKGVKESAVHPLRHPDQTLLNIWAALSLGAGAATRLGAAGGALKAGENAVTRKGYEGGSLLHKPEPGTFQLHTGPEGEFTVNKPLSRNAALRQAQKLRLRRVQGKLDRGAPAEPHLLAPGRFAEKHASAENTVGNLYRTQRRLEQSHAMGDPEYLRRVSKQLEGKGEQTAWRVTNIEGDHALNYPDETINRHIATHQRYIQEDLTGANRADQERIIRDLETARTVLHNPSKRFMEAVVAGRQLSEHGASESISRGLLSKRTADRHLAEVAQEYGSPLAKAAPSISRAARRVALAERPSQAVVRAQARVDRLEKVVVKAADKSQRRARYTAALSVAKEDLQRATSSYDTRLARRHGELEAAKNTESKVPPGAVYFHMGRPPERSGLSGLYNPRQGGSRIPMAQPTRYAPELRRQWKGLGLRRGYVPGDMGKAITESYVRRLKAHSTLDLHQAMQAAATATRESRYQRPIATSSRIEPEFRRYLRTIEQHPHATDEELAAMTHSQLDRLNQELWAEQHHLADHPLGTRIKGVKWVDQRYLKDLGVDVKHPLIDAVTNPIRAAQLYLRPAYLLNALGNAAMLAPEGPAGVAAMWRSARSDSIYGPRITAWVDSEMGSGKALGQSIKTGAFAKTTQGLANFWNTVTDMHMRRGAFLLEAKRAGFKTQAELERLRTDPKLAGKRNEITERSRNIIGDYENLGPAEKNTIRRVIYFYPWLKVATKWTGHMLGEHPIQSALLAQNSKVESAHAKKILGLLPQWARLSGLVPIGKTAKGIVDTVNPSSINTPSTVVQTAAAGVNTARGLIGLKQKGTAGLSDVITPAFGTLVSAAGQTSGSQATGLLGQVEQLPLASAAKRLGWWGKPSKTYPGKGAGPALEPLAGGGLVPRQTSVTQLNKSGETELKAGMSPGQRVDYTYKLLRGELASAFATHGGEPTIPLNVAKRLNLRIERAHERAKLGGRISSAQAFEADVAVIQRHGWMKPGEAQQAVAWAKTAKPSDLTNGLRYLTENYFDRGALLSGSVKYLRDNGAKVKLPALP